MSSTLRLVLEDGTVLTGESFGSRTATAGEVVFNTGMVGYPESLTDPSYRGQIMVLTYPLIGNYGVADPGQDQFGLPGKFESERIQASGLIVSEYSREYSHYTATRSLHQWLESENIPAIAGIDTRALTRHLRDKGSMLGKIETDTESPAFYDPNTSDLGAQVSTKEVVKYQAPGDDSETYPTIIVLDCGCKTNIIRSLLRRKMNVVRVPHDYYFLNMDFDGLVISNGPGDPKMYSSTVRNVKHALAVGKPILGICLGIQLLARAVGAETYKLKFGHRSHNQPCIEHPVDGKHAGEKGTRCYITSQNHGYVVRRDGLPEDWRVWFTNANDNTVEGIRHISKPFMAVQFHPEACPGPVDTAWIFDDFGRQVNEWQQ